MHKDDIIQLSDKIFFKYSNIVKNSYKETPWKDFIIKQFDADGEFNGSYTSVKKDIFRQKDVLPYTIKFNPEKLI